MLAVVLRRHGGPEVLTFEEVPSPDIGPEEVLVNVAATALNRADVLQRLGMYANPDKPAYDIPGLEFAGTVEAIGERVRMWHLGDRVMGIVAGGGYAQQLAVHERQLLAVPESVDLVSAAAIPEVFLTAWDALVVQGGLTSGRWALVHAGASGVGTAAIQIAKAIGARIAVTCSEGKMAACRELGADVVAQRSPHDWFSDLKAAVPGGFDVVLDVVGGDEVNRNLASLAKRGTVVQIGTMGGSKTQVNVALLVGARAKWIGSTLRARPLEEKIAVTRRFAAEVLPLFDQGALKPVIDSVHPFADIADAHRRMESNVTVGKLVIAMPADAVT